MEGNLCVTLVICQESLHDAQSTKCKILFNLVYELDSPSLNGQTIRTLHVKTGLHARTFIYFPEERKEVLVGRMRRYIPSFTYRRKTGLW
jgi:hypothetical protein